MTAAVALFTAGEWHLVHPHSCTLWLYVMQAGQQGAANKARSQAQKVKKAHRKAKLGSGDKRNSMTRNRRRNGA